MEKIIRCFSTSIMCLWALSFLISCGKIDEAKNSENDKFKGHVYRVVTKTHAAVERLGEVKTGELLQDEDSQTQIFNEKGKVLEEFIHDHLGNVKTRKVYKYNSSGDPIEILNYSGEAELEKTIRFYYSGKNRNYTSKVYDSKGNLISYLEFINDEFEEPIEIKEFDSLNQLVRKDVTIWEYKKGKLEKSITKIYNREGDLKGENIHAYNENEQISNSTYIEESEITTSSFKYDEYGNMSQAIYSFSREPLNYSYRLDEMGNWIEKIEYAGDIPQKIIVRDISYYR